MAGPTPPRDPPRPLSSGAAPSTQSPSVADTMPIADRFRKLPYYAISYFRTRYMDDAATADLRDKMLKHLEDDGPLTPDLGLLAQAIQGLPVNLGGVHFANDLTTTLLSSKLDETDYHRVSKAIDTTIRAARRSHVQDAVHLEKLSDHQRAQAAERIVAYLPYAQAHERAVVERTRKNVQSLPEPYRSVILLGMRGLSLRQIAGDIGCTLNSVKHAKKKALNLLRDMQ